MDLEANPVVNKDNPPDLKHVADAAEPYKLEDEGQAAGGSGAAAPAAAAAAAAPVAAARPAVAEAKKAAGGKAKGSAAAAAAAPKPRRDDVLKITDSVIQKVGYAAFGGDSRWSARLGCSKAHSVFAASLHVCLLCLCNGFSCTRTAAFIGELLHTAHHQQQASDSLGWRLQVLGAAMGDAAGSVDADVLRRLTADVAMELNVLRNHAYTNGFNAAKGAVAGVISRQFA